MAHRVSCHICGNIRKTILRCASCVQVFCYKCQAKAIKHHGEVNFLLLFFLKLRLTLPLVNQKDVFENGCISCKKLCCCYNKKAGYTSCSFEFYHCYKKCIVFKDKFQPRGYAKKQNNTSHNNSRNNSRNNDKDQSNSSANGVTEQCIDDSESSGNEEVLKFSACASDIVGKYPMNYSIEEYNYISPDCFDTNSLDATLKSAGSSVIDEVNALDMFDYEYGNYAHQDAILREMDNSSDFSYGSLA